MRSLLTMPRRGEYRIIVFGEEPRVAYDRVYLSAFFENRDAGEKHPEGKLIDIRQKTWIKMSEAGRDTASKLPLSESSRRLIGNTLEG